MISIYEVQTFLPAVAWCVLLDSFVSDNAGEYDETKRELLAETFKPFEGKVASAKRVSRHRIKVEYEENGVDKVFLFDLATGEYSVRAVK